MPIVQRGPTRHGARSIATHAMKSAPASLCAIRSCSRPMGLLREFRYETSTLIFGLGVFGMVLWTTQNFFAAQSPDFLRNIHRAIGGYVFWVGVLGFFAVLVGGFYFFDTILKDREFGRLISTPSKEVFVKNLERLENLADYHLPSAYRERVFEKKREFRLKD